MIYLRYRVQGYPLPSSKWSFWTSIDGGLRSLKGEYGFIGEVLYMAYIGSYRLI